GRLEGQGRLLLHPARDRQRDRLQHQARAGRRRAEGLEGPARAEVARQDGHRAPGLQRRDLDPRAGARPALRLGLLQAARAEQAHARAVGGRSRRCGRVRRAPGGGGRGDYYYYQIRKKGNPMQVVHPKKGVPAVASPTAIASFAPHPNAAKLFTDFTFTRELQQVMADSESLYTGHPEVKYPADKPKLSDLKLLTVDPEELEKRNEEIKIKFVEVFGA